MAFAGNIDELALLQSVRLKGRVAADALASHLGVGVTSAQAAFDALLGAGRAEDAGDGSIALTDAGVAELEDQLEAERVSIDEDMIGEVADRFEPLDEEFAVLVGEGGEAGEDFVTRLIDLDRRASDVFDDVSAYVPRLARYQELFADALGRVKSGESDWIAEPSVDSYAVVWSELRREVLSAAGR